jgi:hypothetical protein
MSVNAWAIKEYCSDDILAFCKSHTAEEIVEAIMEDKNWYMYDAVWDSAYAPGSNGEDDIYIYCTDGVLLCYDSEGRCTIEDLCKIADLRPDLEWDYRYFDDLGL